MVPDATPLLKFRHLFERPDLPWQLFAEINALLAERGQFLREGTIVDATILTAPPSTKNKGKDARPEMHQTKKGNAGTLVFARQNGHAECSGSGASLVSSYPV